MALENNTNVFMLTNPYPNVSFSEKKLKAGRRWIWRTSEGTYIRAKHGPIGVELDRINQQNEQ
jgi:translation elongation factor P/translation initiation factor 5A